ncbi:VOC family protein [Olivibacter domesticus]|uniref:3-demethylubiquinone-9 3-methyltransferase n=1 Tax=Olivibacter domesticus TaxID=407022 RepID=A0A1H7MDJ9_OLID1|nr:VOC family protein [Olivibacter domesticus]SEL08795.1 3-demethylubiquinone-9 3-methyltransferase [Olivibacter domesticus]
MEKTTVVQKISPNLWFDRQAEDAANFYVSIFKNSKIGRITRYSKIGFEIHGMKEGAVRHITNNSWRYLAVLFTESTWRHACPSFKGTGKGANFVVA